MSTRARCREQLDRVRAHAPTPLDLVRVERLGALARRVVAHRVERPAEVDRRRPRAPRASRRRGSRSSPRSAASAMPYAAATPIAGAPRTASTRIASASSHARSRSGARPPRRAAAAGRGGRRRRPRGGRSGAVRARVMRRGEMLVSPLRVRAPTGAAAATFLRPSSRGTWPAPRSARRSRRPSSRA